MAGPGGPARRAPGGEDWARLDWVFLPSARASAAEVRSSWWEELPDHFCLSLGPAHSPRCAGLCRSHQLR
eukprot:14631500-Alexandrium_andersonii.AAC.1